MSKRIKKMAQHETPGPISRREEFNASNFTGRVVNGLSNWDSGRLTGSTLDQFRKDCTSITYVVYSYATPIAWYCERGWYTVPDRFSQITSSKHQSRLYLIPNANHNVSLVGKRGDWQVHCGTCRVTFETHYLHKPDAVHAAHSHHMNGV